MDLNQGDKMENCYKEVEYCYFYKSSIIQNYVYQTLCALQSLGGFKQTANPSHQSF